MNRYLLYTLPYTILKQYTLLCYSDIDIIYTANLANTIFKNKYKDTKIYAICECDDEKCHESYWHFSSSHSQYDIVKNKCAANSGFFLFKNTQNNIETLRNIVKLYHYYN